MKTSRLLVLITVLALISRAEAVLAQIRGGGLVVAPTRVEMTKQSRSVSLSLINNGNETSTYRLKAVNSRMTETGDREIVDGEGLENENFADKMIRFAPRQIRLKPGEQQTVRVMARLPAGLEEGEYRTGLNFQWIPDSAEPEIGSESKENESISVNIQFSYGVTIPVIIRNGDLTATGQITDLELVIDNNQAKAVITLEREGNRSLYGDFSAYLVAEDGSKELIQNMRGVAIYVPNTRRIYTLALPYDKVSSKSISNKRLKVEYREPPNAGGQLIAESIIDFKH